MTGPSRDGSPRGVRRASRLSAALAAAVAVGLMVAACGSAASPSAPETPTPGGSDAPSAPPSAAAEPTELVVGLGYIPSVQFAQFYLADQRGYYEEVGLDVEFQNQIDPDLIRLVGQGAVDLALADGTSLVPAVSQGIPVRYVATVYARFPNIVFADASSGISTAADLEGRRIGIPGRFGSGWIMLQAILGSAGLGPDDATVVEYPDFGQLAGVQQGAVDAATGFVNNEPVVLELEGGDPVLLRVDDIVPLPGNGLITGESTAAAKPNAVRAFIAATLRAMEEIIAEPEVGLEATFVAVPELASDRAKQLAILEATIQTWQSPLTDAEGLGAIDPAAWAATIDYLGTLDGDLVPNPVAVDELISTEFLPE
jgi:NitT/TauT family transport system substrate-binding protein